jgi:uncharacterized membrane protein YdjX (TVP38/TMEM64 family)
MTRGRLVAAGAVLAGILVAALLFPAADLILGLVGMARGLGAFGVVLFFVAYVAGSVAFLPGAPLTMAAGFVYGPAWGLALASPASVAGASAAFLLGRTLLRDWAAARVGGSPRARAIDAAVEREGFTLVLLLRLSPVFPFNVLNYVLSLTRVRFATYVIASFIGMLPGTALYVYLGSLAPAAAQLRPSAADGGAGETWLYAIGLMATAAVAFFATRLARRALAAAIAGE